MRIPLLLIALVGIGSAAHAERLAFDCDFTTRCDSTSCTEQQTSYILRFDTASGTGELLDSGQGYGGLYLASTGMHHFAFVNAAGSELVSIADSGQAIYSGHMVIEGVAVWYRLEGQCTGRRK